MPAMTLPSTRRTPWHSRGYLPHFEANDVLQSVTFSLHDAVPASLVASWRAALAQHPPEAARALRERIARHEDAGFGSCVLRDARMAALVESSLLHFDAQRYRLIEWCVMPNHVHVLLDPFADHPLSDIVQTWKSFIAHRANRILGRRGALWMADYFDRYIRDEKHFVAVRAYIRTNPVSAKLCNAPGDWRWSSAWRDRR